MPDGWARSGDKVLQNVQFRMILLMLYKIHSYFPNLTRHVLVRNIHMYMYALSALDS